MSDPMQHALGVLRERFGFDTLYPLQEQIIARVLTGGDALVVMPTGGGKSLCFQLPALVLRQTSISPSRVREHAEDETSEPRAWARAVMDDHDSNKDQSASCTSSSMPIRAAPKHRRDACSTGGEGVTLVFSPLIALMEDQVSALKNKGIRAEYVNSTLSKKERLRRYERLASGDYELIYATPERMTKPDFVDAITRVPGGVRLLAIDECHCVSKWGHDLRPAYQRVGEFRERLGSPTTIALTATATRAVRDDVRTVLGASQDTMPLFASGIDRPNLALEVRPAWDDEGKAAEIADIAGDILGTGIVYMTLIKDLHGMADLLRRALPDRPVEVYHGKLDAKEKRRVYRRFIHAPPGEGLVLIATNAFGMGVDKPDIRFIIHAQVPGSVEAYHQEVGRAGRDGEPSRCAVLYCQDDLAIQHEFVRWKNPTPDLLMRLMSAIEARFAQTEFDADDLRLAVIGKGHAHGQGGGVVEQALITLGKHGAIEPAAFQDSGLTTYRFVRTLDDDELDPDEIESKRQRDLKRLLDVVHLTQTDDIARFVREYFEL